jgi:hypothetical protein
MGRNENRWERVVRQHFDFLLDHGFRFAGVEHSSWQTSATYLSDALGIEVAESREFSRVELDLIRLDQGKLPEHQIWVTEEPTNRVLFDNVLQARAPELMDQVPGGLSKREVESQVRQWAELLRSVAPDFVQGDGSAILEAEKLVRERVDESPQELTIWLPSDASEEHERDAIARAEETTPPEVGIVVRRYRR